MKARRILSILTLAKIASVNPYRARREQSKTRRRVAACARETPSPQNYEWRFSDFPTIAEKHGLSVDALSKLAALPDFPVFSRKICPALMRRWLIRNMHKLRLLGVD